MKEINLDALSDLKFSVKHGLKQHVSSVHEGKKYKCLFCNCDFSDPGRLKRHTRSIHETKIKFDKKSGENDNLVDSDEKVSAIYDEVSINEDQVNPTHIIKLEKKNHD